MFHTRRVRRPAILFVELVLALGANFALPYLSSPAIAAVVVAIRVPFLGTYNTEITT